ncbi:ABC transporter permease [Paenibacillus cucumis (ex Kampfer et al. 2016)]|uniref:Transport permease protein n=1 Tax=Paenibacillus cucumis (ex Kampfer et al. 2016) TaxID=1776858 RepID=A0ABS7KRL7_9BACL|nr:ABC transporter permease [Paenibacillus cucumis (ex Kampfer et al. 2016)]MBY0206800.1 ABC transporter permease [Paenibacillus cucumis (ex Kampfer et al. 2016)]
MKYFKHVYKSRYILRNLVKQDLRNRYRNSILGVGWTLLTPLGLVAIIGTVYSTILNQPIEDFLPYLFSGLMPWLFIVQCADGGTASFISAEGYIKQTQTPIEIFPIRVALVAFVNLIYSLLAFSVVYIFLKPDKYGLDMIPVFISLLLMLMLGIALSTLSAVINTYFRDYAPLQSLVLQGMFYATPIMFPTELLNKPNYRWIYEWNPFYYIMDIIRKPLLGDPVYINSWIVAPIIIVSLWLISIVLISKIGRTITFRI